MLSLMIHARRSTSPAQLWLPGPCLDRTMNTVIARVNQISGVSHPMFLRLCYLRTPGAVRKVLLQAWLQEVAGSHLSTHEWMMFALVCAWALQELAAVRFQDFWGK